MTLKSGPEQVVKHVADPYKLRKCSFKFYAQTGQTRFPMIGMKMTGMSEYGHGGNDH